MEETSELQHTEARTALEDCSIFITATNLYITDQHKMTITCAFEDNHTIHEVLISRKGQACLLINKFTKKTKSLRHLWPTRFLWQNKSLNDNALVKAKLNAKEKLEERCCTSGISSINNESYHFSRCQFNASHFITAHFHHRPQLS